MTENNQVIDKNGKINLAHNLPVTAIIQNRKIKKKNTFKFGHRNIENCGHKKKDLR